MKESIVQKQIIQYLILKGFLVIRVNSGGVAGSYNGKKRFIRYYMIENTKESAGLSDLLAFYKSVPYFLEIKTGKYKQTEKQKDFETLCQKRGLKYHVLHSLEEAETFVKEIEANNDN